MSTENAHDVNPYQAPSTASEAPPRVDPGGPPLASRINRLGAAIIDGLIAMALTVPVGFLTGYFGRSMENQVGLAEVVLMGLYGLVIFFLVHGYLLATQGQTVGKKLVKIRIVDFHSDQILSFGKVVGLRYVPVWIVSMIPYVSMLGLVDVLFIFGQERRCVHDYIAGTKVVDVVH